MIYRQQKYTFSQQCMSYNYFTDYRNLAHTANAYYTNNQELGHFLTLWTRQLEM